MPIVNAMVAEAFSRFGVDLIRPVRDDVVIAAPMVAVFVLLSALPMVARWIPSITGTLSVGAGALEGRRDFPTINFYLIHWPKPSGNRYIATWRAFEKLYTDERCGRSECPTSSPLICSGCSGRLRSSRR